MPKRRELGGENRNEKINRSEKRVTIEKRNAVNKTSSNGMKVAFNETEVLDRTKKLDKMNIKCEDERE